MASPFFFNDPICPDSMTTSLSPSGQTSPLPGLPPNSRSEFGGPTGREVNVLSFIKFEFMPNAAFSYHSQSTLGYDVHQIRPADSKLIQKNLNCRIWGRCR